MLHIELIDLRRPWTFTPDQSIHCSSCSVEDYTSNRSSHKVCVSLMSSTANHKCYLYLSFILWIGFHHDWIPHWFRQWELVVFCIPRWNIFSNYPNCSFNSPLCEFITFSMRLEQLQCIDWSNTFYAGPNSVHKCTKTKDPISLQVPLTFRVVTLDYCSIPTFSAHMYTLHTQVWFDWKGG